MRKFKWYNSYVKHVGTIDTFDSDTFCLAVDTITFENVDYDYFSIQTDNSFSGNKMPIDYAKYTLAEMTWDITEERHRTYTELYDAYYFKYCKKTLDEHNI